ncbi:hypothetical protein PINS_up001690 [Pythium insidiosum]|nr:hypothetical protein PINS_up001690 [Pythium insidiosum]
MELWGTLVQRIGGGGAAADSDSFVEAFFSKTSAEPSWALDRVETEVHAFIKRQLSADKRRGIALVTSGATAVPLDPAVHTFVDQSSQVQEYQGPACAEYLLHLGYAVIFVHREDSQQPFTRHFRKYIQNGAFLEMLHLQNDQIVLDVDQNQRSRFANIVHHYRDSKDRLLNVSFTSVQQYLHLLRLSTKAINAAKSRAIVILAASVMEFYVPVQQNRSPTSSQRRNGEFSVNFVRVPNLIRKIRKKWCPKAFVVTFKHHLKDNEMIEQAHEDLEKWGVDVVAGTNRHEYPHQILLVSAQEESIVSCPEDEDINDAFASSIAELHRNFRRTREILEKGKQLLILTAKFAMLKERDAINEDADGNKNVKFGKGVKICADRRVSGKAPVYELKHIFQNKSHCARAHVWESKIEHKSGASGLDVVVAFSPAGNPETIKSVWGDFWSGWAEKELIEVKDQLVNVSLSSALGVVASSISGDYTPASNLIQYMWSKIGTAWTDGEQTRIRQSLQNMIAVGLNRGLVEATDITPLEEIIRKPRTQRFDSLILDQPTTPPATHTHSRRRRYGSDDYSDGGFSTEIKANKVRVHQTILEYLNDMFKEGFLDVLMEYVERGAAIHITGYSMGGMLGQLLMLYIGDRARMRGLDCSKVSLVGFGSPRVGDVGFAARMRLLFEPEQLIVVMHPSDTVHAFPPTAEGYEDAALKIFLKEDGMGVGRRTASAFSLLPITKSLDRIFERGFKAHAATTDGKCEFCSSTSHSSEQHRCRYCTERGSHRGVDCPNRNKPCMLCGHDNHCTGEHRCRVCQQYGHRGRECHAQRDVGIAEIVTYFRFHHFVYYNANLKKSVEFTTG